MQDHYTSAPPVEPGEGEGFIASRRRFVTASSAVVLGVATAGIGKVAAADAKSASGMAYVGPVKRLQLAHPRAGITPEEFDDHWRHPHGTLVHDMRGNRKYVQHHRLKSTVFKDSDSTYLAIAEVWHDSMPSADLSHDPHFLRYVQPDEPNFVDPSRHIITMAAEDVVQASRGAVAPDAPFGDLYWSDKDANVYVTLTQFVRDRSVDWTREESLALSRRLGVFRQVINRSVEPDSQMAIVRQFMWPTQWLFEQAVKADPAAFESLRRVPSSFLYLARSERVF